MPVDATLPSVKPRNHYLKCDDGVAFENQEVIGKKVLKKAAGPPTITAEEDQMVAWPHPVLRFQPREGPPPSFPATKPGEYKARLKAEGLTFTLAGNSPDSVLHEAWRSKTGAFTFRQLRHIIQLRYHYMDLQKCSERFFGHQFYEGADRIGTYRGEPVYAPFFGS